MRATTRWTRDQASFGRRARSHAAALMGASLLGAALLPAGAAAQASRPALPFDFNGDGYAELAVGVPGEALGRRVAAGAVNVLRGSASGPTTRGDRLWHQGVRGVMGRVEQFDEFGSALASGDFDADGFADLAVGVPGETVGSLPSGGAVQVLRGSPRGLTAAGDQLWYRGGGAPGAMAGYGFGSALAVGDFDGDGFDDLAVGVPGAIVGGFMESGQVVVLHGSTAGLVGEGSQVWDQTSPGVDSEPEDQGENWSGDLFGAELAAGDVDGDGRDDLAIGVPFEDHGLGAVQVLLGSDNGLTPARSQYLVGEALDPAEPAAMDGFGSVLVLADLNADGRADLAAGRGEATLGAAARSGGRVSVMYAGPVGALDPATAQDWNLEAHFPNPDITWAWFGRALASGDLTGDGVADLAVGASGSGLAGLGQDGAVYLLTGSAAGLVESALALTQNTPGVPGTQESLDAFGMDSLAAVRLAGGATDWLAVGALCEAIGRRTCAGTVTVVPGSPTGLVPSRSSLWSQARAGVRGTAERFDRFGIVSG